MKETIKNLKKSICTYPNCKNQASTQVAMPVGEMKNGQIVFPQDTVDSAIRSDCSLCEYHAVFAEKGIIQLVNQNGMVILVAPTEVISLIEKVIDIKLNGKTKKTD